MFNEDSMFRLFSSGFTRFFPYQYIYFLCFRKWFPFRKITRSTCIWPWWCFKRWEDHTTSSGCSENKKESKRKRKMLLRQTFWSQSNIHGGCIQGTSFSSKKKQIARENVPNKAHVKHVTFICWWALAKRKTTPSTSTSSCKMLIVKIPYEQLSSTTTTTMPMPLDEMKYSKW